VQLPDLKALFKESTKNQKAIEKIGKTTRARKSEEETEFEGDGRERSANSMSTRFSISTGTKLTTLVKKDGKDLSAGDQKKKREDPQTNRGAGRSAKPKEAKEEKARQEGKGKTRMSPGSRSSCARASL